jgi:phosphate transport system substrate-binding protein
MKHFAFSSFLLLLLGVAALAGCSGRADVAPPQVATEAPVATEEVSVPVEETPAEETPTGLLPPVDPGAVGGDIVSAGSSTVFPLAERMAERFQNEGFSGQITIDSIGSGAGFERFCVAGETDVSNASRPIKDSEVESCRAIGREPVTFRVGTDALAVTVSKDNGFVESLTLEQLALIFSTAEKWSDVDPAWPNEPILRYSPGTDSGTFDYFVEEIFAKNEEPLLSADNLQLSEDDNVLVQGVEGSPYTIGYFGYAYYQENRDKLRAVAIEGIEPSLESVNEGTYPLARPLFIYSDPGIMQSKPQVAAYINFFLTYVNEEIIDVGYFPASDEALRQSIQNWLDAMGQ